MDILAYDIILQGAKDNNTKKGKPYGNVVVPHSTTDTTYPHSVITEIRNVANPLYNTCYDRVASVGYRVDVYAKNKGTKVDRLTVARVVAQSVDEYMTGIGLTRISFNVTEEDDDGGICHIIMTYSGNLHENRRKLI
jgi:hypothetical protein